LLFGPRMRRSISSCGLLVLTLLPTLAVGLRAWAAVRDNRLDEVHRKILSAIPRDAAALINVTAIDMPASPDILALGKRSTRALERCLANNADGGLRGYCADLLGILGDRSALPTLHGALEDWEPAVRGRVVVAIGKLPHPSSLAPLLTAFRRKDESGENRAAIMTALGALGHPQAVAFLRGEVQRRWAQEDLRPVAFRALWRSRHLLSRANLVEVVAGALASDNQSLVYDAVLRAAELRARECTKPLLALIEHPDPNIRNKAVYALGLIGDRRAVDPLLALLPGTREARQLNNIAFALERIDKPAFYARIRGLVQHQQAIIRLNAAFVLGDIRAPEALPLIEQMLRDPSDRVKLEAIEAVAKLPLRPAATRLLERALQDRSEVVQAQAILWLGQTGTQTSIAALEPFAAQPETIRGENAIYAIHRLSGGKRTDLLYRLYLSKDHGRSQRAAIALGQAGDPRVRATLLACLEAKACAPPELEIFLRGDKEPTTPARVLLAWAAARDDLTPLVAVLRPPGATTLAAARVEVARSRSDWPGLRRTIDLVAELHDGSARPQLQTVVELPDVWVRLHATLALARLGDRAAEGRLLGELDTLPAEWLPAVARLLMRIDDPAARARLLPELARREAGPDFAAALAAAAVRLAWAPEAAFPRFLRALASPQVLERELAARYLWHHDAAVDALLRRALATEKSPHVRDDLLRLLEVRG
jgi:HEAT repeat protein